MNESFREEFSEISAFKFFTQDALLDLRSTMKRYEEELTSVRDQLGDAQNHIANFEKVNGNFS